MEATVSKAVCYKTVDVFAGITKRRLWLVDTQEGGYTDGHAIGIPFQDPDCYLILEHELAHVLFESNGYAMAVFLEDYGQKAVELAATHGMRLDVLRFRESLGFLANVLEDHRVDGLWGLIYRGSAQRMKEMEARQAQAWKEAADGSLLAFFVCATHGVPVQSSFEKYRGIWMEALRKVEFRGFGATLLAVKWLVTKVVTELIEESKEDPTSQESRVRALKLFVELLGSRQVEDTLERAIVLGELRATAYPTTEDKHQAAALTAKVLTLDVKDTQNVQSYLDATARDMQRKIEKTKEALRATMEVDAWLAKDAMAKVVFSDVSGRASEHEDRDAVCRLRARFNRIHGRRKNALSEAGTVIDIPAYLEGRFADEMQPCFQHEVRGRGFRAIVLLDRSHSMLGRKERSSDRVCRVLTRALRFPAVRFSVWGFQSTHNGQVDISRFSPDSDSFSNEVLACKGNTPLHVAIRVACRALREGNEIKHLFVVTDGEPCYVNREGQQLNTAFLHRTVAESVQEARRRKIGVSAFLVTPNADAARHNLGKAFQMMFGSPRFWTILPEKQMEGMLVQAISSCFLASLRRA